MAFEPLKTDEPLPPGVKPEKDMDAYMIMGCSSFVGVSIGSYILTVWPFFAFAAIERLSELGRCLAFGLIPALIVGVVATRKYGLAAGFGFVGGAVATAIFMMLRIQGTFVAAQAEQLPPPDYPSAFQILIPLGWVVAALVIALSALPKGERLDD